MQTSSQFTPFRFVASFLFVSLFGFTLGSVIDTREHSFPLFSLAFVAIVTFFFIRHRWPKQSLPCAPAPLEWPSAPPAPRPEPSAPAPPRHAFRSYGIMSACALLLLTGSGCAQPAPAQGDGDALVGRYVFRSSGHTAQGRAFVEVGEVIYGVDHTYIVNSTYVEEGSEPKYPAAHGTYSLHADVGQGTGPFDHATFYVNEDATVIYAVGTDPGSAWIAELHR